MNRFFMGMSAMALVVGSFSHAQIPSISSADMGVQKIKHLIVTDNGTEKESDRTNVVMELSGSAFSSDGDYSDYIWIKTGSLRNNSILPEDIEGELKKVGVVNDQLCPDIIYPNGMKGSGFVIGFEEYKGKEKATIVCANNNFFGSLWSYDEKKDAVYRKGKVPTIYVGDPNRISDNKTTVVVDGVTKIEGSESALRVVNNDGKGGFIDQNSINTDDGNGVIGLGKNNQAVGVATTPMNGSALTVDGDVATQGGWRFAKHGNALSVKPYDDSVVIKSDKPLFFRRDMSRQYADAHGGRVAYASDKDDFSVTFSSAPVIKGGMQVEVNPTSLYSGDKYIPTVDGFTLRGYTVHCTNRNDLNSCTMNGLEQHIFSGGISFKKFEKDPIRVMMGFTPSSNDDPKANLTVNGGVYTDSLQFPHLSPSSNSYKTLEQVECKLLTLDANGKMKLVEYMPERCEKKNPPVKHYSWEPSSYGPCINNRKSITQYVCVDDLGNEVDSFLCGPRMAVVETVECISDKKGLWERTCDDMCVLRTHTKVDWNGKPLDWKEDGFYHDPYNLDLSIGYKVDIKANMWVKVNKKCEITGGRGGSPDCAMYCQGGNGHLECDGSSPTNCRMVHDKGDMSDACSSCISAANEKVDLKITDIKCTETVLGNTDAPIYKNITAKKCTVECDGALCDEDKKPSEFELCETAGGSKYGYVKYVCQKNGNRSKIGSWYADQKPDDVYDPDKKYRVADFVSVLVPVRWWMNEQKPLSSYDNPPSPSSCEGGRGGGSTAPVIARCYGGDGYYCQERKDNPTIIGNDGTVLSPLCKLKPSSAENSHECNNNSYCEVKYQEDTCNNSNSLKSKKSCEDTVYFVPGERSGTCSYDELTLNAKGICVGDYISGGGPIAVVRSCVTITDPKKCGGPCTWISYSKSGWSLGGGWVFKKPPLGYTPPKKTDGTLEGDFDLENGVPIIY